MLAYTLKAPAKCMAHKVFVVMAGHEIRPIGNFTF